MSNDGKLSIFAGNFLRIVPSMIDFLAQNMETREFSLEIMMAMMAMMAMTVNSHDELAKSSVNSPCASRPSSRPPGPGEPRAPATSARVAGEAVLGLRHLRR